MNARSPGDVTQLLHEASQNNREAIDRLFPLVYNELRVLARRQHFAFSDVETLNTTALVHEAYLKLVGNEIQDWKDRSHFFGVAASAMRHILLDYVKARKTQKRGGGLPHIPLDDDLILTDTEAEELLALNEALERLEKINPRQGKVVECRFFGGMTVEEAATVLDISPATVKRDWHQAQVWLYRELRDGNTA
ncbi:MAG TPA: sigma-70 family RNA polymerase sigma factor [Rhodothermales bacterium]|nr:sigma-70 family RNA polymerase sigma factor [Rhodothermales bacterium]